MPLAPEMQKVLEQEISRQKECPARKHGQCTQISEALGWPHAVPLKNCDLCFRFGGLEGEDSQKIRAHIVAGVIQKASHPTVFGKHLPVVRESLLKNHLTPQHGMSLMQDPGVQKDLKEQDERTKAKLTWKDATSALQSYKSRGILNWTRVDLTIHNRRHISCFGTGLEGEIVQAPCSSLRTTKDGTRHYCGDCKCGERKDAILDDPDYPKLAFPYLECPQKKDGFSNSE